MRDLIASARRVSVLSERRRRRVTAAVVAACPFVAGLLVASPTAYGQRVFGLDTSSAANTNVTQTQWNNAFTNGDGASISSFKFGIVRSSRGGTVDQSLDDSIFYNNMLRGTAAGLLMGSYHYARPDSTAHTAADDAQHYLDRAGMYMKPGYLLPVFDLEAGNTTYTTQGLTDWALEFTNTILAAKGITPIVYVNSSYANDEVNAQLAWLDSTTPKTSPRTYQWLARPSTYSDLISGQPAPALPTYPNPYGVWDPNFTTRAGSPDPAVKPWVFWQNGSTHLDPTNPTTSTRFLVDLNAVNGNMEFLKDFLVPALWTTAGSAQWTEADVNGKAGKNWNSYNPAGGTATTGPASRLPNSLDWVRLQNAAGGTVTLSSGAQSIRKFYTQQPFNMTGGSLTIGYVPGSGGKWDLPSEFAAAVTLSSPAAYSAHTTQVDGGGGVFNINGGTVTFTAINLASHGSNPGKIVLGGDATFAPFGGAGTAVIQSTGALAQAGFVDLGSANRTLTINNGSAAVDVMISAKVVGTGGLTKAGAGTLQLTGGNTYSGATTVNAGTLTATGASALGASTGALTVANPNTGAGTAVVLNLSTTAATTKGSLSGTIAAPSSGANTATINNGGQLFTINQTTPGTFAGVIAGGGGFTLGASSTSTLTLSGANTFTGGTTINAGTLAHGANNVLADSGAVNVAGGTLNIGAFNDTVGAVTLTGGTITGTTGTLTGASYAVQNGTISAKLGGTGALTKTTAGTVTLSGANTYSGGTSVAAGTLVAANADAFSAGALAVANGATARLQAGLPRAATLSTLNTNTSGKLDVTDNSMVIKGMTDSAVRTQLQAGYNAGAWNGVTGIVSTSITAETSLGYATQAQTGITDFKGVTGLAGTDVLVKYTFAGDANLDGKVDIGDLGLLAGAWQQASGKVWFDGDFTYDGAVDIGDLGLLSGNWQKGTAGNPNAPLMDFSAAMAQFSAFDGVAVPEPASAAALLFAAAALGLGTRHRRR